MIGVCACVCVCLCVSDTSVHACVCMSSFIVWKAHLFFLFFVFFFLEEGNVFIVTGVL